MDLSRSEIRAFNATVEAGSYTQAALALGVSQPAITVQIRKLESRFHGLLFERLNKGVRPTALGEELYRITRQYQDLEAAVSAIAEPDKQQHSIRLATASPLIFIPLFADYYHQYPDATLHIISGTTAECQQMLQNREVDIGLYPSHNNEPGVSRLAFHSHRLMAVFPVNHPLTQQAEVSVHELIQQTLIFSRTDAYTQQAIDRAFASQQLTPRPNIFMDSRYDTCEAVYYGLGVGFALENDIHPNPARYHLIPVAEAPEQTVEHLVWLKVRSALPHIKNFVQFALEKSRQSCNI